MSRWVGRLPARVLLAALLSCAPWSMASVAAAPADDLNLGVASCAGSTCHASTRPFLDRLIRQDEYFIWQRKDRHAQAWKTLLSERSRSITAHLGLGAPEQAPACLVCHAHAPPEPARGARFLVDDGIGCEACHGASERWLAAHVDGLRTVDEKVAHGMTATWDAGTRAQLCSGCHVADTRHPMTHAIMAAGHPPLLFELDTFTELMPPHWDVDADYARRKPQPDAARNWLEGQIAAADAYLGRLESGALSHGLFPELALFDCDACHHPLDAGRWHAGRAPGRAPGAVPLADQPLVLLQAALQVLAPQQAQQAMAQRLDLYRQYDTDVAGLRSQAGLMRQWLQVQAIPALRTSTLSAAQLRQILRNVVTAAQSSQTGDFYYAQQTAMATQVLTAALAEREPLDRQLRSATDALYGVVRDRGRFQLRSYLDVLHRIEAAL